MRLDKLREAICAHDLDALLITDPQNRRYISGFTGSAGWLLVTQERAILVVDFRYFERAAREAPDWEQARVSSHRESALVEALDGLGVRRLGIEGDHVVVSLYHRLGELLPRTDLVPLDGLVLPLRARKDPGEVAAIRAAVACADGAWAHLCQVIRPGMTEAEVSWTLESHMRQHGASAISFSTIVGSGPNGAMPHATSSDRPIAAGEPVVIDFGALVDGYCSDITRTICLGHADDRYLETWQLVLEVQQRVEAQLRPGMRAREADAIARDRFAQAGCGEAFGHGLGHGVGLAIHEEPFMGQFVEDTVLEPGMVFTVEPGLYFPGWGGVRIEDIVYLGEEGAEVLTQAPKTPVLPVPPAR
ncbi:MAG: aminopeptidase P family protein [Anaerolineae bacterium]|nr:aminopeptidase P family protein [Anaerolineae bacterium]